MKISPQEIVRRTRERDALQCSDSLSYAYVLNGGEGWCGGVAANDAVLEGRRVV